MKKKENISKADKKYWEEYLKNPSDVFDKDNSLERSSIENLRFKFDLHGYGLLDANKKVKNIIFSCYEKKYKEIFRDLLKIFPDLGFEDPKEVYSSNYEKT